MNGSPERRCWPSWERAANAKACSSSPVGVGLVRLDVCDQLVEEVLVARQTGRLPYLKCTSAPKRRIVSPGRVAEGKVGYRPNMTVLLARLPNGAAGARFAAWRGSWWSSTRRASARVRRPPLFGSPAASQFAGSRSLCERRQRLAFEQGAERLGLEQAAPGPCPRGRAPRTPPARRRSTRRGRRAIRGEPPAELAVALGRLEDPPDDELRRGRPVPRVRLEAESHVVGAVCRQRSSCEPSPNAIALPAGPPSSAPRKRRCLPSPTVCRSLSSQPGDEQRHARVAESERRQPPELVGELERAGSARHDGVDDERRSQVVVGQLANRPPQRTPRRTRRPRSGRIESPAAARWPPKRSR